MSHNINRSCKVAGCKGYSGPNLKKHLQNCHLKKAEIFEDNVERYFHMGFKGRRTRGPTRKITKGRAVKGRPKRWCPQPGCDFLGAYMPEHLAKVHKIKPGSANMKISLTLARKYMGAEDEIDMLVKPAPPIVQVTPTKKRAVDSADGSSGLPPPSKRCQMEAKKGTSPSQRQGSSLPKKVFIITFDTIVKYYVIHPLAAM